MRLLVTDAAAQPPRQATAWLIMTLGRTNMIWRRTDISHARRHQVQLYVRQIGPLIEAYHACESLGVCQMVHHVVGDIDRIRYDQEGSCVAWREAELPGYCRHPELDCRRNEIVDGHEPKIADLGHGIANMMNQVFSDPGFSRFAKKLLIGEWKCGTSDVSFLEDGTYHAEGDLTDIGRGMHASGVWSLGRNQIVLLDSKRTGGIRTQLVQIDTRNLIFHGREDFLFQKYKRK